MLALLLLSHSYGKDKFVMFLFITYSAGLAIEILGVNTKLIFGDYEYGKTLGLKLFGTPLMIGVNWVILIYCTGVFLSGFKLPVFIRSMIGATLLVFLDVLIEPVAVKFDYWHWKEPNIPLQNYIAWFIFSALLLHLFSFLHFKKNNPAAIVLLCTQLLFFAALNLWAF
ncbi:MAG: carotenoid biosynthesis protein [Daejeonella sp.]